MTNEEAIVALKQLILQGTDERLKKDYKEWEKLRDEETQKEAIDIAIKALETGEVYMTGEDYNLYMEGYKASKKDFEPKKGEWVLNKDKNPECPFCHHSFTYWGNFCGNCGAKM